MAEKELVIAIIGTCDTKLAAMSFIKEVINSSQKCKALLIDIGSFEPSDTSQIDIPRSQVLESLPSGRLTAIGTLTSSNSDRSQSMRIMTQALTHAIHDLHKSNRIHGIIGAGGSGNTTVCTEAFQQAHLPIGFPKLMVSTMASGDVQPYVAEMDLTMVHSVVDVAGMNAILASVLNNAAHAILGMVEGGQSDRERHVGAGKSKTKPTIAATMFGVTTPCIQSVERRLTELGYDVVVFHATGSGGKAMEKLIAEGRFQGVLDITTTELADDLLGGVLSAGPKRLEAASKANIPQVISLGALDMVNFGPPEAVPQHYRTRKLYHHNSSVTLMRTTSEECARLGQVVGQKANRGDRSKTKIIVPLRGVSALSEEGKPFWDEEADQALVKAVRESAKCDVLELDCSINNERFASAAVDALIGMLKFEGGFNRGKNASSE